LLPVVALIYDRPSGYGVTIMRGTQRWMALLALAGLTGVSR